MPVEKPSFAPSVVEFSVVVSAPPGEVWQAILDPDLEMRWMGGFRLVSDWEVGGAIGVRGTLQGRTYQERGTVLALDPGALLRYDHWSQLWRVPDLPATRAVLELRLEPVPTGTEVRFRHELPAVEALAEHSRFFWRVSLNQLKKVVEGRDEGPSPPAGG